MPQHIIAATASKLVWSNGVNGQAYFDGVTVDLPGALKIDGLPAFVELDYVPRVGTTWIREPDAQWREMTPAECAAVDAVLRGMADDARRRFKP